MRPVPSYGDPPINRSPYSDFHQERVRAHGLHRENSLERVPWHSPRARDIVLEELGEVARVFNEFELGNIDARQAKLQARKEVIQLGAMVSAWADAFSDLDSYPTRRGE